MKPLLTALIVVFVATGCTPKPDSTTTSSNTNAPSASATASGAQQPTAAGSSDSVRPIGPNIGAMTPVAGGENLSSGTGGGVGQMAKEQAKKAAGQSSSTAQATDNSE